ncbi:uncharacterized protein LOC125828060 [Solanum verrucosum]|uniref:uncharacterized protein LOC125828060 n=1 Tax=Solanum verrucosum TaxID=315347 RepID=UPI0020D070E0|nr:uncharacterized protein LOC125828060 [Solanum verrucosum]
MCVFDWDIFKVAFFDSFFPLETREAKALEFINLHQGNMSVKDYALKFTQLSKYAPTIVANPRAMMSKFVSGASDLVIKERLTAMVVKEMDVSCLMVHAQQTEEEKLKEKTRNSKSARRDDGDFSHSGSNGSNHFQSNGSSEQMVSECQRCGKLQRGECLAGYNACFGFEKMDHKIRSCPTIAKNEGANRRRTQPYLFLGPSGGKNRIGFMLFRLDKIMRVPRMR